MKKVAIAVTLMCILTGNAQAYDPSTRLNASEFSVLGSAFVIAGSMMIVGSPFILVTSVAESSSDRVEVTVNNDKGEHDKMLLSKEVVMKAKLQPGDTLTVTPTKTGAVLSKNDQPVMFMLKPENTKLTRSHELAQ